MSTASQKKDVNRNVDALRRIKKKYRHTHTDRERDEHMNIKWIKRNHTYKHR